MAPANASHFSTDLLIGVTLLARCAAVQTPTRVPTKINPWSLAVSRKFVSTIDLKEILMNRIVYLVGAVVIIVFLLGFLGLR